MFKTDQKHMLEDSIDHPKNLIVSSKSKRVVLVDTEDGNSVLVTGDFSDSMRDLEKNVHDAKSKWPLNQSR
jgi:hypothetical protein